MKTLTKILAMGGLALGLAGCGLDIQQPNTHQNKHRRVKVLPYCYLPKTNSTRSILLENEVQKTKANSDDSSSDFIMYYLLFFNPASPVSVSGESQNYSASSSFNQAYGTTPFEEYEISSPQSSPQEIEIEVPDYNSQSDPGTIDSTPADLDVGDAGSVDTSVDTGSSGGDVGGGGE